MNIITGEKIQQLCNVYFGFKEDFDYVLTHYLNPDQYIEAKSLFPEILEEPVLPDPTVLSFKE